MYLSEQILLLLLCKKTKAASLSREKNFLEVLWNLFSLFTVKMLNLEKQVKLARTVSHVDVLHILLQEIWLPKLFPKFETLKKMEF